MLNYLTRILLYPQRNALTLLQISSKSSKTVEGYYLKQPLSSQEAWRIMANDSFKSLFNGFLLDIIKSALNIYISDLLLSTAILWLDLDSKPMLLDSNLTTKFIVLIACKFTTSILLSPLDLIHTRLVNQSSKTPKKYPSITKSLILILNEEYTITELFCTKILIIPTLAHNLLKILFGHSLPLVADRILNVRVKSLSYIYLQLSWGLLELFLTLPVETVSKRLQSQMILKTPSKHSIPYKPLVPLSSITYTSVLECTWRMISDLGIQGLYTGFRYRLVGYLGISGLHLLAMLNESSEVVEI